VTISELAVREPDVDGLRVLAFCDYFSPGSCGGSERVAAETYRRLAGWGANVTLVTASVSGTADGAVDDGYRVVSVPARDLSGFLGAQLALSGRLFGEAFRTGATLGPQVIHAHSLHFQGSVVAATYQRARKVPMVTTVHLAGLAHLSAPVRLTTGLYERTIGRFILGSSAAAIAVSEPVAAHVITRHMAPERVLVVHNGVDHEVFHPAGAPPGPRAPNIVFVGRLLANKGPQLLMEALAELAGEGIRFTATFVGDGPMRSMLARRAGDAGIADQVRMTGAVPPNQVAAVLRTADVAVRPSFSEGLPLAVLEAMACGVCVVASDVAGNAELVSDGTNGLLFQPGDAQALAMALRRVLGDEGLRRRLAADGHRTSLGYSWDACAAATGEILAAAARRPSH